MPKREARAAVGQVGITSSAAEDERKRERIRTDLRTVAQVFEAGEAFDVRDRQRPGRCDDQHQTQYGHEHDRDENFVKEVPAAQAERAVEAVRNSAEHVFPDQIKPSSPMIPDTPR